MGRFRQAVIIAVWLMTLVLAATWITGNLSIATDLRLFLPAAETNRDKLLLEQIGEGPASRLLLLAISGGDKAELANTSRAMAGMVASDGRFRWIANGDSSQERLPEEWLPYRYLLSSGLDQHTLDGAYLSEQLQERLRDLTSPAAGVLESIIPRDPTLEVARLLEAWQPQTQPHKFDDVWFSRVSDQALLVVQTSAPGLDPVAQREAIDLLREYFNSVRTSSRQQLTVSGPGAFSTSIQERIEGEARWLSGIAAFGTLLLLFLAYRSLPLLFLGALPIASGALAGLAAVTLLSGSVHGITIAFGFTLIGVAQDYPLHLFSHRRPGISPIENAREVWPTLATGAASTCIAYLAFLISGVRGLSELAIFSVSGLAVAALTTRFCLPALMPAQRRDAADAAWLGRVRLPRPRLIASAGLIAAVGSLLLSPGPFWQEDLGALTPIPRDVIELDTELRRELGAPDVRHLVAVGGATVEEVLLKSELVAQQLDLLVAAGDLKGYDHPARYLPSITTQKRRQAALPEQARLRSALDVAVSNTPFRPGTFEPFLVDVETARELRPLTVANIQETPLQSRLEGLVLESEGQWVGLITLSGLKNPDGLTRISDADPAVIFLDLKQASEQFVARHRQHILECLALAAVCLALFVAWAVRSLRRAGTILVPIAISTVMVVAILDLLGIALTPFHLIALVLTAGLGLDYSLFFDRAPEDSAAQRRTLHAVIVCASSTLLVFSILASSELPVLRAIGLTVALGVSCNFLLALALVRADPGERK